LQPQSQFDGRKILLPWQRHCGDVIVDTGLDDNGEAYGGGGPKKKAQA
jgi:hypothetical protein